ncbi:hypothetical protein KCU98_g21363, partial [Aureobasidium melanogenum]
SQLKTGHPVRSAIHKQLNGRLVLRWVTTWESLLLYVLFYFVSGLSSRASLFAWSLFKQQVVNRQNNMSQVQISHGSARISR